MKITKWFMIPFKPRLSLLELLVVLTLFLILTGVTASIISVRGLQIGPEDKSAQEILTQANLQNIFKAIMGDGTHSGYYQDMGQYYARMPHTLADLFLKPTSLLPEIQQFNPLSKLGWRGPYLVSSGRYGDFKNQKLQFRANFGSSYGNPSDPSVLDAWGNPIVLQIDFDGDFQISQEEARYARLVSAGSNQKLETPLNVLNQVPGKDPVNTLTLQECGDDLVLFLQVSDLRE